MAGDGGDVTTPEQLEEWVREELSLSADATVDICERPGTDPRCGDVVTEVSITEPGASQYAFHIERPLAELEPMDVVAALAFGGGH